MSQILRIGLDIGSTTIKCVVLDEKDKIIYSCYERHLSLIAQKTRELLTRLDNEVVHGAPVRLSISGSAGMGLALGSHISFVQEVYATKVAADMLMPGTDVIIELGGEDAKILFLQGTLEVRMNGSCAGGTGAFIDQMATLLGVTPTEMNEEAKKAQRTYTIASRCGVFAKTDVQPLLNQGAARADVARSIFMAVVNQTIAGLAQGRPIEGKVVYLGGPLTFMSELRACFDEALHLTGVCPENSLYFVALGAAQVDLLGPLCAGYQQDDIVRHDLGKAVADDHLVPDALGVKPDGARTKCGNDRFMPRLHAVFTVERRHDQTVCRAGIKLPIRRDDLQIEGVFHQSAPISCAFRRTSSTVPTMEKAASGY